MLKVNLTKKYFLPILFLNSFFLHSYALGNLDLNTLSDQRSDEFVNPKKDEKLNEIFSTKKNLKLANESLLDEAKNLESLIDETMEDIISIDKSGDSQNKYKNQKIIDNNKNRVKTKINLITNEISTKDIPKGIEVFVKQKTINTNEEISLPNIGDISVGEFKIPVRGYVDLEGPNITLNLKNVNPNETLVFLAKSAGYGLIFLEDNPKENSQENANDNSKKESLITASFTDIEFSQVFNSLLMASGLQAKVNEKVIFIGKDISDKGLNSKYSKTYRLNQASAASVGDYLATLGATISKVYIKGPSIIGDEFTDSYLNNKDLTQSSVNSYGIDGGPLKGLIGTVDLRLQSITLIGDKDLISTAEKYIKNLDARHRQVALSIKIIDVSLTKSDLTYNRFDAQSGNTFVINNSGLDLRVGNTNSGVLSGGPVTSTLSSGSLANNQFVNWLSAKIKNENAKIVASPTLILGESSDPNPSGAAEIDDELGEGNIGRPFSNEAFIKVGETVTTSFSVTTTDGVTTCTGSPGTAGITFGAKLDKVDDNGFVTFSLSPAISAVTKTETIANCGVQSVLSVRKLDSGSVRVKDGNTLVLTGVLKDEDNVTTSKTPILGDIPLFGRIFRNNDTVKRKSELIILVTPKVLKE